MDPSGILKCRLKQEKLGMGQQIHSPIFFEGVFRNDGRYLESI